MHVEGQRALDVLGGEEPAVAQVDDPLAAVDGRGDVRGRSRRGGSDRSIGPAPAWLAGPMCA